MIAAIILPVVRRAILDLIDEIGGEHNDDNITMLLVANGHRVARRDVRQQLEWLATQGMVAAENLGPYLAVRILPDGQDVAAGRLQIDGIHRHKTGD